MVPRGRSLLGAGEFIKRIGEQSIKTSNFIKIFINYAIIFDFHKPFHEIFGKSIRNLAAKLCAFGLIIN